MTSTTAHTEQAEVAVVALREMERWSVPGMAIGPGANVPPLLTVIAPTLPLPASSAPLLTAAAELAIEPSTTSAPALTVVAPV